MQRTCGVEDGALSAPAGLEPGDLVKVIYVEMGDERIIRGIVKASCNRRGLDGSLRSLSGVISTEAH